MAKKKLVILFSCVGRRVSLLRSFRRACRAIGRDCVIIGTDTTENSAALQCCDRKYIVKPVTHRDYPGQITEIVKKEKADLLIPTIDLDLAIWARRRAALGRMGCTALISSSRVVKICQDKRLTYSFLKEHGFNTPHTVTAEEILQQKKLEFPYFLKPWDGHASRGSIAVKDREELGFFAKRIPNCIVQEFITGQEHTIDVLVDFDGKVRCVVPRRRIEVRDGEVSKGVTNKNPAIIHRSKELIEALGAGPGVITIQCFLTQEEHVIFIEINPRFGGGAPLSIKAGANFPLWILQLWLGLKPNIRMAGWRDGKVMLRYDEAVWYQK